MTAKKKKAALIAALLMVVTVASGCATFDNFKNAFFADKDSTDTIIIGVLEPQSGEYSEKGKAEIEGIELAHDIKGEIGGKEIELIYGDTQSSVYVTESVVNDMVSKNPDVILGAYGDAATLTASTILEEELIPAITISATNPLITQNSDYYFRMSFTDSLQGDAVAQYMKDGLGQSKAVLMRVDGDEIYNEIIRQFRETFRTLSGDENSVITVSAERDKKNYDEYLEKIKDSGVKAVFAPMSVTDAEKMFQSAEKLGMNDVEFIGPLSWHGDDLKKLHEKFPDLVISAVTDYSETATASPEQEEFVKAYREKYGKDPTEEAARAYDAYMIAVEALERSGGVSGEYLRDEIAATSGYPGVSGTVTFNERGEASKPVSIDKYQMGQLMTVFKSGTAAGEIVEDPVAATVEDAASEKNTEEQAGSETPGDTEEQAGSETPGDGEK